MNLTNWDSIWITLACICIFALVLPAYLRNRKLRQWRSSLSIVKHEAIFNQIYRDIKGFEASKEARHHHHDDIALTYGEIEFESFIALISLCKPNINTIFYDLGSGTGKAVIATAMVFPVKSAIGIECLSSLDNIARQIKNKLIYIDEYQDKKNIIEFIHNDFLDCEWQHGNLIYISSTTIIGTLWYELLDKLERLSENSIVITITKSIPSESYEIIYCTDVLMSWGIVTAYIQKKLHT